MISVTLTRNDFIKKNKRLFNKIIREFPSKRVLTRIATITTQTVKDLYRKKQYDNSWIPELSEYWKQLRTNKSFKQFHINTGNMVDSFVSVSNKANNTVTLKLNNSDAIEKFERSEEELGRNILERNFGLLLKRIRRKVYQYMMEEVEKM